MFLFIGMHRRSVAKEVAYLRAAEEVWHWATVPRSEFTDAVKAQVAANDALSELRARKSVPKDYLPDTAAKRLALSYLLHTGEYKVPYSAQKASAELVEQSGREGQAAMGGEEEGEIMSKRDLKRLARKDRKNAYINLNVSTKEEAPAAVKQSLKPSSAESTAAEPVTPEWVHVIHDGALGVTPQSMQSYSPEWSAQGECNLLIVNLSVLRCSCGYFNYIITLVPNFRKCLWISDGYPVQRREQEQHDEAVCQPGVGPRECCHLRQAHRRG